LACVKPAFHFKYFLKKTPLLDRRGAETDERSESDEAGWWNFYSRNDAEIVFRTYSRC